MITNETSAASGARNVISKQNSARLTLLIRQVCGAGFEGEAQCKSIAARFGTSSISRGEAQFCRGPRANR